MARGSPTAAALTRIAKQLAKAKPAQVYARLYDGFVTLAGAGEVEACATLLRWMYEGHALLPESPPTALSTGVIDGFCLAAALGDRTRGLPARRADAPSGGTLAQRARAAERWVRRDLVMNASLRAPLVNEDWRALPDPPRRVYQWQWIQQLAAPAADGALPATEALALAELEPYIADWRREWRGVGNGAELVLAIDLAVRHDRRDLVRSWLASQGHRFHTPAFLVEEALCLPAIARAVARGELRLVDGLDAAAVTAALGAFEIALARSAAAASAPPRRVPKVQKRRVWCEYSQFYLEPEVPDPADTRAYFQDRRESEQGMSILRSRVAIGTPGDTAYVDIEASLAAVPPDPEGAVQVVAFPLRVDGPLYLRNVAPGDDTDPLIVPRGTYDVLACFYPKTSTRAWARTSLRAFRLVMSFLPEGAVSAPRCVRLEFGTPPDTVFVNA